MSDFAEGLISAIAGGVQGGAEATGQIYEDERKNAARIETETQLAQAQAEIQLQKQKQLTVFAESQRREGKKADFEEEGKNLPETLRRTGLIEAGKTDAEKAKWSDPEYRKARSTEEGITNPDRDAEGRALRNEASKITIDEARKAAANKIEINNLLKTRVGVAGKFTGEGRASALADIDGKLAALGYSSKEKDGDWKGMMNEEGKTVLYSGKTGEIKDQPSATGAVKITTKQELDALPKGTLYTAPDGSTRRKQ